jgi:hypothetical protein
MAVSTTVDDTVRAGDPVAFTLESAAEGVPEGSLLAIKVVWDEGLVLTDDECEDWLAPDADEALAGRPLSGDECIVDISDGRTNTELTFATQPAGFTGAVTASETRLVTIDGGDVTSVDTGLASDFGTAAESPTITLSPYAFWMEVEDLGPSDTGDDVLVTIHHLMQGGGADPQTTLEFEVVLPDFATGIDETYDRCGDRGDTNCFVTFSDNAEDEANTEREIPMRLDIAEGGGIGLLEVKGTSLNGVVEGVDQQVRGAEELLVSESVFDVDLALGRDDQPGRGEVVTAVIQVDGVPPGFDMYSGGTWNLTLRVDWPEGLSPGNTPAGCDLAGHLCTLTDFDPVHGATITIEFDVDAGFYGGDVSASGESLGYDPTTAADLQDRRPLPPISLPSHWIGSATGEIPQ